MLVGLTEGSTAYTTGIIPVRRIERERKQMNDKLQDLRLLAQDGPYSEKMTADACFWAAEEIERLRAIIERAYLIARGGIDPQTLKPRDRFTVFGRKQLYWKGRADAASDIREAMK